MTSTKYERECHIDRVYDRAYDCWRRLEMKPPSFEVKWRGNMGAKRCASAHKHRYMERYEIRIGGQYWLTADNDQRNRTVDHEVCHIAAWQVGLDSGHGIGSGWWRAMKWLGYDPAQEIYGHTNAPRRQRFKCGACNRLNLLSQEKFKLAHTQSVEVNCRWCRRRSLILVQIKS